MKILKNFYFKNLHQCIKIVVSPGHFLMHNTYSKTRRGGVLPDKILNKNEKRKLLLKGTVRPDWICMRVVPLESPLKGHQPLYVFDFLISVLNI